MPPMVELSEIREALGVFSVSRRAWQAFREAKVVRFDATKLLPKQMFNSTLQLVNDMCLRCIECQARWMPFTISWKKFWRRHLHHINRCACHLWLLIKFDPHAVCSETAVGLLR